MTTHDDDLFISVLFDLSWLNTASLKFYQCVFLLNPIINLLFPLFQETVYCSSMIPLSHQTSKPDFVGLSLALLRWVWPEAEGDVSLFLTLADCRCWRPCCSFLWWPESNSPVSDETDWAVSRLAKKEGQWYGIKLIHVLLLPRSGSSNRKHFNKEFSGYKLWIPSLLEIYRMLSVCLLTTSS